MDSTIQYLFRGVLYTCEAFVETSAAPCYIFVFLKGEALLEEFGEEITIKTNFETLLPKQDDYSELVELRQAIFNAAKNLPAFQEAKSRALMQVTK